MVSRNDSSQSTIANTVGILISTALQKSLLTLIFNLSEELNYKLNNYGISQSTIANMVGILINTCIVI